MREVDAVVVTEGEEPAAEGCRRRQGKEGRSGRISALNEDDRKEDER